MTHPITLALAGAFTLALPFAANLAGDSGDHQTIESVVLASVETDLVDDEPSTHDVDHELIIGEGDDFRFRFRFEENEFGFGFEDGEFVFDHPEGGEWNCDE